MQKFRLRCEDVVVKIITLILFHSRALRLINLFVNSFQLRKNQTGAPTYPYVVRRQSRNVQILTYHRVNDDHDPFFPATPIGIFRQQMDFLSSYFTICSLENAVERLEANDVPDNALVVTFDDGYRDNYLNAFPMLKSLSIPATIFLPTACIGTDRPLWHDRVIAAFRQTHASELSSYGSGSQKYLLTTLADKLAAQAAVLYFLRSLTDHERSFRIDRLLEELETHDQGAMPGLMLTWEEIKIMNQNGISFGSHTITHPILSQVSVGKIKEEVTESKHNIEQHLGALVKTFAYPSGRKVDFNEATKTVLKESGYTCAVTMIFGTNEHGQDLYELRRLTPWDSDIDTFRLRLNYYKFCC